MRRSLLGQSWSQIRDAEGFTSVGGTQRAYQAHRARNVPLDPDAALEEILERKRFVTGRLVASLAAAKPSDGRVVAELSRAMTASDEHLGKLQGLESRTVDVRVTHSLDESFEALRRNMHAVIDAEVVEDQRELER